MSEERFDRIDAALQSLGDRLTQTRQDITGIQAQLRRLGDAQAQMRNDMGVMHEEVLDRIRIATDDTGPRMEMNRRFDEVLSQLREHAVPGDAADRYFARKINEHERQLRKLEER
jgi:hypothetical protein